MNRKQIFGNDNHQIKVVPGNNDGYFAISVYENGQRTGGYRYSKGKSLTSGFKHLQKSGKFAGMSTSDVNAAEQAINKLAGQSGQSSSKGKDRSQRSRRGRGQAVNVQTVAAYAVSYEPTSGMIEKMQSKDLEVPTDGKLTIETSAGNTVTIPVKKVGEKDAMHQLNARLKQYSGFDTDDIETVEVSVAAHVAALAPTTEDEHVSARLIQLVDGEQMEVKVADTGGKVRTFLVAEKTDARQEALVAALASETGALTGIDVIPGSNQSNVTAAADPTKKAGNFKGNVARPSVPANR